MEMEMGGGAVPSLPQDLLFEILSRLSVKDLMRFRCVSNNWKSLMFHPALVKLHLQRASKSDHVLLTFREYTDPDPEANWGYEIVDASYVAPCSVPRLLEKPRSCIDDSVCKLDTHDFVVGACNGLVCLREYFEGDGFDQYLVRFWNPATKIRSTYSPSLLLHSSFYETGHRFLGCGFGFDDSCDAYKVVATLVTKSQQREVRVHCLGDTVGAALGDTGWKMVISCAAFPILGHADGPFAARTGQFASGTVNWLALRWLASDYQWKKVTIDDLVIFSYDLKDETYRFLSMPHGLQLPCNEPYLGVLNGCLCLSHDHRENNFVVWIMREFGNESSWIQLLNVPFDHLQSHPFAAFPVVPLYMSENEDVLILADYGGLEFVVYNRRDNIIDRHAFNKNTFSFFSYEYVQSLVLPYRN